MVKKIEKAEIETPIIHYVCIGGCGIISEVQGKCNSQGCWRARNPLGQCECTDGLHAKFFKLPNPQS